MLTIYQIYAAIAFVILLSPFVFYRFTRLENPVPCAASSLILRLLKAFLMLLSLVVYFGLCSIVSSFFYLQSYPDEQIFGMDGAEWGGYLQGDAPDYYGPVAVVVLLVFAIGSIFLLSSGARRWEAKVWENPGNITSKGLRAIASVVHLFLFPTLVIIALSLLFRFFQNEFFTNLEAIPFWLGQALDGELAEDVRDNLIAFAVIVGIFLLLVLWALFWMLKAILSSFWPKTEATIVHSELYQYISTGRTRTVNYRFLVEFTYMVEGFSYTSNRLTYNIQWLNQNKPFIFQQTRRYPLGAVVQAYVNPNKPEDAVLEAGIDWFSMLRLGLYATLAFVLATTFLIPEVIR
jgi:hypothetical protein